MAVNKSLIGNFIDAVVLDPPRAKRMLRREPRLKDARWLHGETILHFLAIEGKPEHVKLLGQWGFDPNATNEFGDTPLVDIATLGREEAAAVLLDLGADPNAKSRTQDNVLRAAVFSGNARLVDLLLRKGAKPDIPEYVTDIAEWLGDASPREDDARAAIEAVFRQHKLIE